MKLWERIKYFLGNTGIEDRQIYALICTGLSDLLIMRQLFNWEIRIVLTVGLATTGLWMWFLKKLKKRYAPKLEI